jgi:hypothetical protein
METKELRKLNKIAKRIVEKKILRKIRALDNKEKTEALTHFIKLSLDLKINNFEKIIKKIKKEKKEHFFAETKLNMLKMKTKLFNATLDKKDFKPVILLIKCVENELKHA